MNFMSAQKCKSAVLKLSVVIAGKTTALEEATASGGYGGAILGWNQSGWIS